MGFLESLASIWVSMDPFHRVVNFHFVSLAPRGWRALRARHLCLSHGGGSFGVPHRQWRGVCPLVGWSVRGLGVDCSQLLAMLVAHLSVGPLSPLALCVVLQLFRKPADLRTCIHDFLLWEISSIYERTHTDVSSTSTFMDVSAGTPGTAVLPFPHPLMLHLHGEAFYRCLRQRHASFS